MTNDTARRPIRDVCAEIKADVEADVHRCEGAEFTGRNVAEMFGNLSAAVSACAGMIAALDERTDGVSRFAHDGDALIYDGIGKRELDRLRSLLTHRDRDQLTTWEVIEVAACRLVIALAGTPLAEQLGIEVVR